MKPAKPIKNKDSRLCTRIMKSVRARGRGIVVTWKDFQSFGQPDAIRQALSRLVQRGVLRRVARGFYDWPRTVAALGMTVAPGTEAVVAAVARRDGARIVPAGARAANLLGLSTQVPARDLYLSTGSSHHIRLGKSVIQVRHAPARVMAGRQGAALVISALAHLGARDVNHDDIARLKRILPPRDKAALRHAAPKTFRWMRPVIASIAQD